MAIAWMDGFLQHCHEGPAGDVVIVAETHGRLKDLARAFEGHLVTSRYNLANPPQLLDAELAFGPVRRRCWFLTVRDADMRLRGLQLAGAYAEGMHTWPDVVRSVLISRLTATGARLFVG